MGMLFYRAAGAAMLDAAMYEGIEADRSATRQALVIVLLSSLAAGIGAGGLAGPRLQVLGLFGVLALVTWVGWAALILQVGGRHLREPNTSVDLGELLRTVGFAASPGLLQALAAVSEIAAPVFILSWVWMLVAMVVAVQHALDFRSPWRAVLVCVVSLILALGMAFLIAVGLEHAVA